MPSCSSTHAGTNGGTVPKIGAVPGAVGWERRSALRAISSIIESRCPFADEHHQRADVNHASIGLLISIHFAAGALPIGELGTFGFRSSLRVPKRSSARLIFLTETAAADASHLLSA
jgi:hypothetical protein